MKTFFTADSHYAHEGILDMVARPFTNIEEHDDHLLELVNLSVQKDDRLFIVGDFAWRAEESFAARIICKNIHFIYGNHDKAKVGKLFKTYEDTTLLKMRDIKVFLSHYPHAYWPASHYNSFHLYGHMHAEREETLDTIWPERRSMDVGVDNAFRLLGEYRPFSEDDIFNILSSRKGHDELGWYKARQTERMARKNLTLGESIQQYYGTPGSTRRLD